MSKYKQSPFHNRQIIKGEYGKLSKIEEELDEARDAAEQGIDLMVLIELSDDTDEGYHHVKYDIEVKTEQYGWMETHSCSYFADEQVKRFGIEGGVHTISNTGLASPRVLIPFIEAEIPPEEV